jgi:hypothetical protein
MKEFHGLDVLSSRRLIGFITSKSSRRDEAQSLATPGQRDSFDCTNRERGTGAHQRARWIKLREAAISSCKNWNLESVRPGTYI